MVAQAPLQLSAEDGSRLTALFADGSCLFALARSTGTDVAELIAWLTLPRIHQAIDVLTRLQNEHHRAETIRTLREAMTASRDLVEKRRAACAILRAIADAGSSRSRPQPQSGGLSRTPSTDHDPPAARAAPPMRASAPGLASAHASHPPPVTDVYVCPSRAAAPAPPHHGRPHSAPRPPAAQTPGEPTPAAQPTRHITTNPFRRVPSRRINALAAASGNATSANTRSPRPAAEDP
jgi:hypothetical protein